MHLSQWFLALIDGAKSVIQAGGGKRRSSVWARRSVSFKAVQDLEVRCLLSAMPVADSLLTTATLSSTTAAIADPSLVQLSTVGTQEIINGSEPSQIPLIYGPIWSIAVAQTYGTPQTPAEDLYDEGAGAVWGTIADEGVYGVVGGLQDINDFGVGSYGGIDTVGDYGAVIGSPVDGAIGTIGGYGDYGAGAYGVDAAFDGSGALDSGFDDLGGVFSDGGYGIGVNGGTETGTDGNHPPVATNANWTIDEQPAPLGLVPPIIAGTVQASDPDDEAIMYMITRQQGEKSNGSLVDKTLWEIGMGTGEVYTRQEVDYEAYKRWYLTVQVADMHGGTTTVGVTINITDVDEAPVPYGMTTNIPVHDQTNVEGESFTSESTWHYAAYDPEGVHPLGVRATNLPDGLEIKTRLFDIYPEDAAREFFVTQYWIEGRLSQDSAGLCHVVISLADQSGHSVEYKFDWEVLNFSVDIYQMTFSNGHEITPDPQVKGITPDPNAPTSYAGTQWLDVNRDGDANDTPTDRNYPYAYHRTQRGSVFAGFELENAFRIGGKIKIRATGTDGYNIAAAEEFWVAPGRMSTDYYSAFTRAFETTKYYAAFTLTWQFSVDNGATWEAAGETTSRVYVMYKAPMIDTLFETVVHVSTVAAAGAAENTDAAVADAIFQTFETRSISRFDGRKAYGGSGAMTYWGYRADDPKCVPINSKQLLPDIAQLLHYTDGRCGHWGQFFVGMLRTQGIAHGDVKTARAKNMMADGSGRYEGLIINNANFGAPAAGQNGFNWREGINFTTAGSIPGQGGTPMMQSFSNHALVLFNGKLYDPSYGTIWEDLADFETRALAGLFTFAPPGFPGIYVRKEVAGFDDLTFE